MRSSNQAEISRVALFGKLGSFGYRAIEGATVFCKLRGNPYVELEHWVSQIVQSDDSDWHRIMRHFEVDSSVLARDLTLALDRLPRGATSVSNFSDNVTNAVERGWVYSSLLYAETAVRSGHLLLGILKTSTLRHALVTISRQFDKIRHEDLAIAMRDIVAGSPEDTAGQAVASGAAPGEASGAIAPAELGRREALTRFTTDLTAQAREAKMDNVVGRDDEIRQLVDILMRRRQNNPILVGEAGVGKTAIVEGFAQRIVRGDVPPALIDVELRTLDVGLLQAGASMKGEFEQRLRSVIDEVQASPVPIILFVDETHTLVGAGGAAGTGDAANLLKPALARGTLRTIGATTWTEYRKHIEKDPALSRRFQSIKVDEPDEPKALSMMRGVALRMEEHHRVQILDEALEAAVTLSHRYIPSRQLPDKSVSLLDTACARVAVSLHATPAEVDDSRRRIEALDVELAIIGREDAMGIDTGVRASRALGLLALEKERLATLDARWSEERLLVDRILALRAVLNEGGETEADATPEDVDQDADPSAATGEDPLLELKGLQQRLKALQGERPLVHSLVDYQAVASVVGDWTGIPVGRMASNEIERVLGLATLLAERVIGQDHAMQMIARRVQTSRAGLDDPGKPIGVFLLAGTSGVGKTETALALAECLYGGDQNLIVINMSEYQEAHTVSSLKGAPPGYVGYGEGGVLTEAVRRKPYSVVLLDEVEKAHPDVHELFFQVFDKGFMEDGEGRTIDFRNTLILLTTNVGTDVITASCRSSQGLPEPDELVRAIRAPLVDVFPPALLGRLVVVPYYPLGDATLKTIVSMQLGRIVRRVEARYGIELSYDDDVVALVLARCTEFESGGRMIDAILTNSMLPALSREFLDRTMRDEPPASVAVGVVSGELVYRFG